MSRGHQIARNDDNEAKADGKEDLPAKAHQLVVAIARYGRHDPAEHEEEEDDLERHLDYIDHDEYYGEEPNWHQDY